MSSTYRLTGRVETGELAELYEASQEEGGKVVVKLFLGRTSDPRYATALAETYSRLNPLHAEGIVPVLDMGFVKERLAVVRESVDGYTLGTALQRLNTREVILPPPIALSFILQLLESVQRAHEVGVIHGALTPGNVLLSRAGQAAICDFGALQALLAVPQLKRVFAARGRSAYRAPEVGRGDAPTVLSDIYSLGAIAYELLTLREAVIPEGGVSTRRAGLPHPSRLDRRIHARLDPILLRALEGSPARRFRSCADFAEALRTFLSTHGGMSGAAESRRFVSELFPNEVSLGALGPVPFSERFSLTPISGVSLAQVSADELDKSVVVRPSYSPALNEADTMEAPPAFEEYEPVPAHSPVVDQRLLDSTLLISEEKEGTEVGQRGPPGDDEQTWVAPPGAPPPRPRRQRASQPPSEGTRVGKNPRLRMVEDLSPPRADEEEEEISRTAPIGPEPRSGGTMARARLPPSMVRARKQQQQQQEAEPDHSHIPMPPPTAPEVKAAIASRRMFTEERSLLEDARRRRRMLGLAGLIALVGAVFFAVGAWKFAQRPQVEVDPKVSAVSGAVQEYLQQPTTPPRPQEKRPEPPPAPEVVTAEGTPLEESRKSGTAYLSLSANLPARAFVDGTRVRRRLPLVRYPVKSGTREIIVETLGTPRQREVFELRLERGEHKKLRQLFQAAPKR